LSSPTGCAQTEDRESACFCQLRDARIYVRTAGESVSDGEARCERCPAPSCTPPAPLTAQPPGEIRLDVGRRLELPE